MTTPTPPPKYEPIDAYLDRSSARLSERTIEAHEYSARRWINPRIGIG